MARKKRELVNACITWHINAPIRSDRCDNTHTHSMINHSRWIEKKKIYDEKLQYIRMKSGRKMKNNEKTWSTSQIIIIVQWAWLLLLHFFLCVFRICFGKRNGFRHWKCMSHMFCTSMGPTLHIDRLCTMKCTTNNINKIMDVSGELRHQIKTKKNIGRQ